MKRLNWHNRITWFGLMLLLSASGVFWILLNRETASASGAGDDLVALPRKGYLAPDFTLQTPGGQAMSLSSLRGQVIVVNFWASWCPACRQEMPAMQQVYDQYRDRGLVVLGVNLAEGGEHVSAFVDEMGLTFPVVLDRDGSVAGRYRVNAVPATFFVDRSGVIRDVAIGGPLARAWIESQVRPLLAEGGAR